jgi:hypothetical protein|nr:MAG TPA: hypothetical protein [Caudoviricetes sp.]
MGSKKRFEKEEERKLLKALSGKKSNMDKLLEKIEEQVELKAIKTNLVDIVDELRMTSDQEWTKERLDKLFEAVDIITYLLVDYED